MQFFFRKNWTASLVVLTGNSLVFYKDPKVQAPSGWVRHFGLYTGYQ